MFPILLTLSLAHIDMVHESGFYNVILEDESYVLKAYFERDTGDWKSEDGLRKIGFMDRIDVTESNGIVRELLIKTTTLVTEEEPLGLAVIVDGAIVAWFADPDECMEEWCTENYFGRWLTFFAKRPVLVPLTRAESDSVEATAAEYKRFYLNEECE